MKILKKLRKALLAVCSAVAAVSIAAAVSFAVPSKGSVVAETTKTEFSSDTDLSNFAVANSDGKVGTIANGKYYPNGWAQNYYKVAIPTDQTRLVSFDFYLPSTEDTGTSYSQMWVGLITDPTDINTAGKSLGMQMGTQLNVTYFYKNAQKQGSYLGQFAKMTFGAEHHMEMFFDGGKIKYAIDGNVINFTEGFSSVDVPSNGTDNNAYLFFEFSSAKGWIDNIVISDCTDLDFSSNLVADKYIGVLSGGTKGKAEDGVFKPAAWARNYWITPIDVSNDVVISYDFYMPGYETLGTADKYSQFYAALVSDLEDINGTDESGNAKSITFRLYDNGNASPRNTSYSVWPAAQSATAASSLAWLEDVSYFDAIHTMEIKIVGGAITYYIDGMALYGKTFAVPANTLYFFFEMSHAGGYIDNLKVAELPFEEISLDFSTAATGSNYFAAIPSSTNWSTSNGTFKSGATYRATYMTTPIPVNEFKYIAFDWYEPNVANTSVAANFRFGLTADIANRNTTGNSIGFYAWPDKSWLASHANSTSGWLASLSAVTLGKVNRVEMIIENEKITFIIGGTTLKSNYAIPFADQDTSTKEYAYLVLDDAVGAGAYIDNLVVWNKDSYDAYKQEQLDKQYGIEASDKSFVGYDQKKTPNSKDSGIAWGTAYSALTNGGTIRRSSYYGIKYDWSGAEYYAFDIVNDTDGYVAFGLDVKEGYYAQNGAIADFGTGAITHGRWWTMGEYMPYYLIYSDGTVKSGIAGRNASSTNRGKAVVPAGFTGTLVFPISSFEVLDWSTNTAQYDWFTDDANVPALNHILFADVIYYKETATAGSVTTSNERFFSSDFGAAASVERTIRAIDQIGTVSAASERLIAFARSNYDALSLENQALVTNYETLTTAEDAYYNLSDFSYVIGTDGKNFEGTEGVAFGSVFESAPSTVSAWIKVSRDVADDEHVGTVVGNAERKMSSSVMYDYWNTFSFEITTNGNPKFEWRVSRTNKVVFVVENADVRTGAWMHVAFTRDVDNGLVTCYINGVAVASMEAASAKLADFSFIKPVMIGSDYTNDKILALSFTPDFHGSIADVRVYSTLLNADGVAEDAQGVIPSDATLLGGVDFASGEAGEYYDYVNADATDAFGWEKVEDSYFAAEDGEFSFAVIPDTQMIFSRAPKDSNGVGIFSGTYTPAAEGEVAGTWESAYNVEDNLGFRNMQWLIDNKDLLNLQYVMHVGDLTDNLNYYVASNVNSSYKKWQIEGMIEADYGFQMLNKLTTAGIPWSISRGNHDGGYDVSALAIWDKYWTQSNAYAKATTDDRLENEPAKYCITTRNSVDHIYSYYEKLEINGMKYLILVLDLEAGDSVLAWANEVAAYFTDYKIIVSTHAYLGSRAGLMTSLMGSEGLNNPGQTVWDEFVSLHSNIELMICGHSSGEDIVRKQMTGVNGNKVWTFMIDSSAHEFTGVTQPGLMSILKFSKDGKTLTLNHYSMVQGELFGNYNSFTVNLGEQEETETEEPSEDETVWPEAGPYVELPAISAFNVTTTGGYTQLKGTGSPKLNFTASNWQIGTTWMRRYVTIHIGETGVFTFDEDACLTAVNNISYAVYHTKSYDGLTRLIFPANVESPSVVTSVVAAGATTVNLSELGEIQVSAGDKITIMYFNTANANVYTLPCFDGKVCDENGVVLKNYELDLSVNATYAGLYNAGYNGVKGDGSAADYDNYNGYTMGWKGRGSNTTYTLTITDENSNTLAAVKTGENYRLPTLCKEGYIFKGYTDSSGTEYASGTTLTASKTLTAKFAEKPNGILDNNGKVVVEFTNTEETVALPALTRTGRVFLGYSIDGKLYPAGTVYNKASGLDIVAVFAKFSMINGAAVRFGEPTGMRFQTYLDNSVYENYLSEIVTFGTLIAKADDISVEGVIDYSLLTTDAAITKLDVASTNQHNVGKYLYFNGVLATIKAHHYDWKFAARGYMTVTYADGTVATFYANVTDNARSVSEIAAKAMADVGLVESKYYGNTVDGGYSRFSEEQRTILQGFIS